MRTVRSFRPRKALKRDSKKSAESGGRPLRVEEAARVARGGTERTSATMATQEQVLEVLQGLQLQEQRIAALERES